MDEERTGASRRRSPARPWGPRNWATGSEQAGEWRDSLSSANSIYYIVIICYYSENKFWLIDWRTTRACRSASRTMTTAIIPRMQFLRAVSYSVMHTQPLQTTAALMSLTLVTTLMTQIPRATRLFCHRVRRVRRRLFRHFWLLWSLPQFKCVKVWWLWCRAGIFDSHHHHHHCHHHQLTFLEWPK